MSTATWILIGVGVLVIALIVTGTVGLARLAAHQPDAGQVPSGVRDGHLSPCPASPNCVSTQADPTDTRHRVEPVRYSGTREKARQTVLEFVETSKRATVTADTPGYIRAEFRSNLFKFIDDVEFYLPAGEPVVHFRSAARVGYSDMGVNRRRYDSFRDYFLSHTK